MATVVVIVLIICMNYMPMVRNVFSSKYVHTVLRILHHNILVTNILFGSILFVNVLVMNILNGPVLTMVVQATLVLIILFLIILVLIILVLTILALVITFVVVFGFQIVITLSVDILGVIKLGLSHRQVIDVRFQFHFWLQVAIVVLLASEAIPGALWVWPVGEP